MGKRTQTANQIQFDVVRMCIGSAYECIVCHRVGQWIFHFGELAVAIYGCWEKVYTQCSRDVSCGAAKRVCIGWYTGNVHIRCQTTKINFRSHVVLTFFLHQPLPRASIWWHSQSVQRLALSLFYKYIRIYSQYASNPSSFSHRAFVSSKRTVKHHIYYFSLFPHFPLGIEFLTSSFSLRFIFEKKNTRAHLHDAQWCHSIEVFCYESCCFCVCVENCGVYTFVCQFRGN